MTIGCNRSRAVQHASTKIPHAAYAGGMLRPGATWDGQHRCETVLVHAIAVSEFPFLFDEAAQSSQQCGIQVK
eukprot:27008-Amphidinium_carterae.4